MSESSTEQSYQQSQATVTQVVGSELISNTTIESSTTGWESNTALGTYTAASLTRSSAQKHGGTYSLLATWPNGAGKKSVVNTSHSCTVGTVYSFNGWVYVPSGSPDVIPCVIFWFSAAPITAKDQWVPFTLTFVATQTTHYIGLETADVPTSGELCYVDDVSSKTIFGITVDGATVPSPVSILDGATYVLNDRVTVTLRNPLVPLIEGVESDAPPEPEAAPGTISAAAGTFSQGAVTAGSSSTGSVSFSATFTSTPAVVLASGSGRLNPYISSVSTTGFNYGFNNWTANNSSATTAYWIARVES